MKLNETMFKHVVKIYTETIEDLCGRLAEAEARADRAEVEVLRLNQSLQETWLRSKKGKQ